MRKMKTFSFNMIKGTYNHVNVLEELYTWNARHLLHQCVSLRRQKNCQVQFTLQNPSQIEDLDAAVRDKLFAVESSITNIPLSILDFASADSLMLYRDTDSGKFRSEVAQLRVDGKNDRSRCILAYLRGLLTRKDEIAVIPIDGTDFQLLIFFEDFNAEEQDIMDVTSQNEQFQTTLSCILVQRFNMIFDLDETLIRTRLPRDANDRPTKPNDHEFYVQGSRYMTTVRPGTDMVLRWACAIFKVYIFTNAINEYAIEIAKILDPNREHLLANITDDFGELIKSREQMTPAKHIPRPQGLKILHKFGIDPIQSVIFDDDISVWSKLNHDCILPFEQVTKVKKAEELFCRIRNETWKRLASLHKNCFLTLKKKRAVAHDKPTFSQDHVMGQL
jgi:hypothetical protein